MGFHMLHSFPMPSQYINFYKQCFFPYPMRFRWPLNLASSITLFRIVLVPFFYLSIVREKFVIAVVLLVVMLLSDLLDGYIARKYNQQSKTGEVLDPLADKLAVGAAGVAFFVLQDMTLLQVGMLVSRDITMILLSPLLLLVPAGVSHVVPSDMFGKTLNVTQGLTIIAAMFMPSLVSSLLWVCFLLGMYTGFHYIMQTLRQKRTKI